MASELFWYALLSDFRSIAVRDFMSEVLDSDDLELKDCVGRTTKQWTVNNSILRDDKTMIGRRGVRGSLYELKANLWCIISRSILVGYWNIGLDKNKIIGWVGGEHYVLSRR